MSSPAPVVQAYKLKRPLQQRDSGFDEKKHLSIMGMLYRFTGPGPEQLFLVPRRLEDVPPYINRTDIEHMVMPAHELSQISKPAIL